MNCPRAIPAKGFLIVLLVFSIGTPWGFLQSVAWFGMVVKYSQQAGFAQGFKMTFDGKHPCKMCHFVQQGQSEERQQSKKTITADQKLQFGLPPEVFAFIHPPVPPSPNEAVIAPEPRTEPPPFPPPRC